jgi:membrane carboxypeptidase/penicillin-binding protein PbpC
VYALGIDAGKITPKTVLADVPGNFRRLRPRKLRPAVQRAGHVEKSLCIRSTFRP